MKVVYLANLLGSFDLISSFLFETIADIYIIHGNLIDIPFFNYELEESFDSLQNYFKLLRTEMQTEDLPIEDFVTTLLESPNASLEMQEKGNNYLHYSVHARRVMQEKYKMLENIFLLKTNSQIFTLPGANDMDLKYTALHNRDLHLNWHQKDRLKIAGYGGSDYPSSGVPEKYVINYDLNQDYRANEMMTFFKAIKPSIITTYQPAFSIFDTLANGNNCGSKILFDFCEKYKPQLCLTSNTVQDWGVEKHNETMFINPANFGHLAVNSDEIIEGGFFCSIEYQNGKPEVIQQHKYIDNKVHDIEVYHQKKSDWKLDIIDKERYEAKKKNYNYDIHSSEYENIKEITLFKEIKQFYRMFQTRETEERVSKLEKAIAVAGVSLQQISLDVVGSVNMGLSESGSDIDAVVYVRCGSTCGDMIEQCPQCMQIKQQLQQAVKSEYKIDFVDCINLNKIEHSIIMQDYDCEETQRFVTYRAICRPINYKLLAPIEDILNENKEFRKELESSIKTYFKLFATTSTHIQSFDKYEARLKLLGIDIPETILKKIKEYLQRPY